MLLPAWRQVSVPLPNFWQVITSEVTSAVPKMVTWS